MLGVESEAAHAWAAAPAGGQQQEARQQQQQRQLEHDQRYEPQPSRCLLAEQDKYRHYQQQQAALDARVSHDSLGADWPRESDQSDEVCRLSQAELTERIQIMIETEGDCLPRPDYIEEVQKDGMRVIWRSKVASWLLEFEEEYGISQETIAVAVNYMDRYLSEISTKRSILQLLAMGSIFVATKLHETFPIGMHELRDLADGTYLESDIKLMELELLRVIQWKLTPVTPQSFMAHIIQFIPCPETRRVLHEEAVTFLDVVIPEYEFLHFTPSVIGTAAVLCAFSTTNVHDDMARAWAASVSCFGLLNSPAVQACQTRMLEIFDSMMSTQQNQPGPQLNSDVVEASSAMALAAAETVCADRAEQVVSPVGVEQLAFEESCRVPLQFDRSGRKAPGPMHLNRGSDHNYGDDGDDEMYSSSHAFDHRCHHDPSLPGGYPPHHLEAMDADEDEAPPGAVVFMDHDLMRSKSDSDALHALARNFDFSHPGDLARSQQASPVPAGLCGSAGVHPLSHSVSLDTQAHDAAVSLDLDLPNRLQRSRSATR
ncbi:G1/S-specific cyclin-D2 [Hondaea fermentalgiana]|uniref:G1/S-specific cyclin-D2 n=1 Tax=Hondaea fermentalgiana TaxID=2315210 RepID=A0A2R5GFP5_9STRA|nr:G1/S-specific cyclin-D2 [Hondaea fermentalgiana]|eukprot:GBG29736.1 G1/S-specific cyclin-D2 [Hondaea fermentalgiana]